MSQPVPAEAFSALVALFGAGRLDAAAAQAAQLLARHPQAALVHGVLGSIEQARGNMVAAEASLAKAYALAPDHADIAYNYGALLLALGRSREAVGLFERCLDLAPGHLHAANNLGVARLDGDDVAGAHAILTAVVEAEPRFVAAWNNLSNVLRREERYHEAEAACRRALALDPAAADVWNSLGLAIAAQERKREAIETYRHVLTINPDHPRALYNLGCQLVETSRHEEAVAVLRRAVNADPALFAARAQLAHKLRMLCDWRSPDTRPTALMGIAMEGDRPTEPFPLLSILDDPGIQRRCAEHFVRKAIIATRPCTASPATRRAGPLRIGYFSPDFRDHPVSHLMAGVLRAHDRAAVEVFAFALGPRTEDAVRADIVASVDHFIDLHKLEDEQAAALAREHGIDVAIDLGGHTRDTRLGIFAHRAAPVQVGYLGYAGTFGAPFLDYLVADRHVIPAAERAHYGEAAIFLNDCFMPNDNRRPHRVWSEAERRAGRIAERLPEDGMVFCVMNNPHKICPDVFAVWMGLLRDVPDSVLWFSAMGEIPQRNLRREADAAGIAPDRLIFAERAEYAAYLARFALADLFLDTFAYNAHTTASDALWAGLPVLTRMGRSFAARVAGSLVLAAGLPELAVASTQDYADTALALARDPARLAEVRDRLMRNRTTCALYDTANTARQLERGFTIAHARWMEGLQPLDIDV